MKTETLPVQSLERKVAEVLDLAMDFIRSPESLSLIVQSVGVQRLTQDDVMAIFACYTFYQHDNMPLRGAVRSAVRSNSPSNYKELLEVLTPMPNTAMRLSAAHTLTIGDIIQGLERLANNETQAALLGLPRNASWQEISAAYAERDHQKQSAATLTNTVARFKQFLRRFL